MRTGNLDGFIGTAPGPGPGHPDMAMTDDVDFATPPTADCSTATAIADGTMLSNESANAGTTSFSDPCAYGDGNVIFYSTSVPAGQKLSVTVTPTDGSFDPVLRLVDTCGSSTCDAYADSGYANDPETLNFTNTGASARDVILAVGGYDAGGGTFDLSVKPRAAAGERRVHERQTHRPGHAARR